MFIAGLFGLNMEYLICREFFSKWEKAKNDGVFKGSWDDHRHDMTCGSIIANDLKMKFHDNPSDYACYIGDVYGAPNPKAIFHLKPL
jgi:hypothetical protein